MLTSLGGPYFSMTGVLVTKMPSKERVTHTGRMPCEHEGRDVLMCPQAKECQTSGQPPEARREERNRFALPALRRNPPYSAEFGLQPPEL